MRILLPLLRSIILCGSVLITLVPVFAQTPSPSPTPPTGPRPTIVGSPEIRIDKSTGKGSTLVFLRNGDTANQVKGWLTGVVNTTSNPKPKIAFKSDQKSEQEEAAYQLTIGPNSVASVVVTATDATQVGEFDVELRNGDDMFGTLKLLHFPFAVTLDGPEPNKADVAMVALSPTTFKLKNDDAVSYPLMWRLSINGREVCGDQLTLQAKGTGLLQCRPSLPFSPARLQDLFKVESTEGHSLLLYPQNAAREIPPWKIIPVKASLSYFGPRSQQLLSYLVILLALLAGGLTSLVLNQALPNRLKRLNIRERLMNIRDTTANLRSSVGSRLQVLLRLERSRLFELLESRHTLSPDFAGVIARCGEGTDSLEARVALVQQIDVLLNRLDEKLTLGPPPSQIAAIEALINDARVRLEKAQPTAKDLEAAQAAISEAVKKVDALNQPDPAFGQALAKRALEVQQDINTNLAPSAVFQAITKKLLGPLNALQGVAAGTTEIPSANYASVDTAVEKMLLIKDYVRLLEGTIEQQMLARLREREDTLLNLLQLQSWPAMRSARLLLREMKDDVYPERFKEKLTANVATIVMDPMIAYDQAPLEFCVSFHNDAIDKAAAKEEWTCEWAFGDHLSETGWTVSHYFMLTKVGRLSLKATEPKRFTVEATFRDNNGDPLIDPGSQERITVKKTVNVQPSKKEGILGDRTLTEFLKLGAALLIAVFALVAGAREQLLKLDILPGLIAVFMIGFGADTIKNILSKSESTP